MMNTTSYDICIFYIWSWMLFTFVGLIMQCNATHKKTPAPQENKTGIVYVLLKKKTRDDDDFYAKQRRR